MKNFIKNKIAFLKTNQKENRVQKEFDLTEEDYDLLEQLMLEETINGLDDSLVKQGSFLPLKTTFNSISSTVSDGFLTGKNKALNFKDRAIQFSSKSGNVLKESSNKAYQNIIAFKKNEIFLKLINNIDLLLLIDLLNGLRTKSKNNPKQLLAITGLITLLTYFNRNKSNQEVIQDFKKDEEVSGILKKIPLKDILAYADTVVVFLPPQFKVPAFVLIRILKMVV